MPRATLPAAPAAFAPAAFAPASFAPASFAPASFAPASFAPATLAVLAALALPAPAGAAPIAVTPGRSASTLASTIAGAGVTIAEARYQGAFGAQGVFTGGLDAGFGIDAGIILTTGSALGVMRGFNPRPGAFDINTPVSYTPPSTDNGIAGPVPPGNTYDAAVLRIVFTPRSDTVSFRYVFASGEYPDAVGRLSNDQVSLQVNLQDVALVPGTGTPVSTNTVNNGNGDFGPPVGASNPEYFVDNRTGANTAIPYGGYTVALTATATGLTPGAPALLRFSLADVGNALVDSIVLIEAGSFTSPPPGPPPVPSDVPEPGALALLAAGLCASLGTRALRR